MSKADEMFEKLGYKNTFNNLYEHDFGTTIQFQSSYIEKDNAYKISIPLITDKELREIDNHFETIVKEFTKSYVKEKDLVIAQYVMQKQQDKIDKLEAENKALKKRTT